MFINIYIIYIYEYKNIFHMNINDMFRDRTVLVTGSARFLGKLLGSCSIQHIAILVRSKKGFTHKLRISDSLLNFYKI